MKCAIKNRIDKILNESWSDSSASKAVRRPSGGPPFYAWENPGFEKILLDSAFKGEAKKRMDALVGKCKGKKFGIRLLTGTARIIFSIVKAAVGAFTLASASISGFPKDSGHVDTTTALAIAKAMFMRWGISAALIGPLLTIVEYLTKDVELSLEKFVPSFILSIILFFISMVIVVLRLVTSGGATVYDWVDRAQEIVVAKLDRWCSDASTIEVSKAA